MVESWCCFCMLLSMLRTFRRPSGDFRRVVRHCRKWHSYNGKISRCLQIFVLRILAGMGASIQSCQLSRIIRETPGFEPFFLVYDWSCRSLPFLVDSTMKFQMFWVFWAILLLTSNVSSQTPVCHCNISNNVNQLGHDSNNEHLFHAFFFLHKWRHVPCIMMSFIARSPSILNIWRCVGLTALSIRNPR